MINNDDYMQHREDLKEIVRAKLGEYLQQHNYLKKRNCVKPLFPERHKNGDKSADCKYYPETNLVYDHGLKEQYDIFDYIRVDYGIAGFYDQINKACELFGINHKSINSTKEKIEYKTQAAPIAPNAPKQTKTDEIGRQNGGLYDFSRMIEAANKAALNSPEAMQHYANRGFDWETVKRFRLGYSPNGWNEFVQEYPELQSKSDKQHLYKYIIPYPNGTYFVAEISDRKMIDDYNGKYKLPNGLSKPVYIAGNESDGRYICVEGQYDAISWAQNGYTAIATTGATITREWAKKHPAAVVILAKDNDAAGIEQQQRDSEIFLSAGISVYSADSSRLYKGYKDANAALNSALHDEILEGMAKVFEYQQRTISKTNLTISNLNLPNENLNMTKTNQNSQFQNLSGAAQIDSCIAEYKTQTFKPIKTGEKFFDDITGGGIRRQMLYMLAAAPALGKTTLLTQIAEDIAKKDAENGADCIYINLEMSVHQLVAKGLSRYAYRHLRDEQGNAISLTADEIMRGYEWEPETQKSVMRAANGYKKDIAERLIYCDRENGGADLDEIMQYIRAKADAAKNAGKEAPFIFIDYLHLLTSTNKNGREDDTATMLKRAVTELKAFAMEYNTSVFTIIATGRASNSAGKMTLESGRDSSNIEYSADFFIGLNFTDWENDNKKSLEEEKQEQPRRITIKNLKSRMVSGDGMSRDILFDTEHGLFLEADEHREEKEKSGNGELTEGQALREKYGKR